MSEPITLDAALLRSFPLPRLDEDGDKEDRGRALVIAGSRTVPGAAILAGTAALRAGAGKLQIVTEAEVAPLIGVAVPEAAVIAGSPLDHVREAQSVTFGCGMEPGPDLERLLAGLLGCGAEVPLVLDAAVLGCLPEADEKVRAWQGGVPFCRMRGRWRGCSNARPEEWRRTPLAARAPRSRALPGGDLVKGRFSFVAAPDGPGLPLRGRRHRPRHVGIGRRPGRNRRRPRARCGADC